MRQLKDKWAIFKIVPVVLAIIAFGLPTVGRTAEQQSSESKLTGEKIKWQVISSGGGRGISKNFMLGATAGQTASGSGISKNYGVSSGYWQNFGPGNCCTAATTGDVDASGAVDISDLAMMVDFLFSDLPFPNDCFLEQDVDKSGAVDISDLQVIIDFLFNGLALPRCP